MILGVFGRVERVNGASRGTERSPLGLVLQGAVTQLSHDASPTSRETNGDIQGDFRASSSYSEVILFRGLDTDDWN